LQGSLELHRPVQEGLTVNTSRFIGVMLIILGVVFLTVGVVTLSSDVIVGSLGGVGGVLLVGGGIVALARLRRPRT
jgi:drug/metabolite transporter (DMT)-like permease